MMGDPSWTINRGLPAMVLMGVVLCRWCYRTLALSLAVHFVRFGSCRLEVRFVGRSFVGRVIVPLIAGLLTVGCWYGARFVCVVVA